MRQHTTIPSLLITLALASCGADERPSEHGQESYARDDSAGASEHGTANELGTVTVSGHELRVVRFGPIEPGKMGAIEVFVDGLSGAELADLDARIWIESEDGTRLCPAESGSAGEDNLHFHVSPREREGDGAPARVVIQLTEDGNEERVSLPLAQRG